MEAWRHGDMDVETWTWRHGRGDMDVETSNGKRKTEAQAIFLDSFTLCSECKWKFVVCPLVDEKTN
jgi:hypothetical protein